MEEDRLWFVSSRGEVVCLDAEGFRDKENDGPEMNEEFAGDLEADVIWRFDMMGELGVQQHNMANCSLTAVGNILLVCTSNGVDRAHQRVTSPEAPSFLGLDKRTGSVIWKDNSPGTNVLHGQWSSPAVVMTGDVKQAVLAGGDGWLYSFDPRGDGKGRAKLLWKFDCNPKMSRWNNGDHGDRNNILLYTGSVSMSPPEEILRRPVANAYGASMPQQGSMVRTLVKNWRLARTARSVSSSSNASGRQIPRRNRSYKSACGSQMVLYRWRPEQRWTA